MVRQLQKVAFQQHRVCAVAHDRRSRRRGVADKHCPMCRTRDRKDQRKAVERFRVGEFGVVFPGVQNPDFQAVHRQHVPCVRSQPFTAEPGGDFRNFCLVGLPERNRNRRAGAKAGNGQPLPERRRSGNDLQRAVVIRMCVRQNPKVHNRMPAEFPFQKGDKRLRVPLGLAAVNDQQPPAVRDKDISHPGGRPRPFGKRLILPRCLCAKLYQISHWFRFLLYQIKFQTVCRRPECFRSPQRCG